MKKLVLFGWTIPQIVGLFVFWLIAKFGLEFLNRPANLDQGDIILWAVVFSSLVIVAFGIFAPTNYVAGAFISLCLTVLAITLDEFGIATALCSLTGIFIGYSYIEKFGKLKPTVKLFILTICYYPIFITLIFLIKYLFSILKKL